MILSLPMQALLGDEGSSHGFNGCAGRNRFLDYEDVHRFKVS
jgi:hypothetical protein